MYSVSHHRLSAILAPNKLPGRFPISNAWDSVDVQVQDGKILLNLHYHRQAVLHRLAAADIEEGERQLKGTEGWIRKDRLHMRDGISGAEVSQNDEETQ